MVQKSLKYSEIGLNKSLLKKQWLVKETGNVNNFDLGNSKDLMGFGAWPVYWILNKNKHSRATASFLCWYDGGQYPKICASCVSGF